jgi:hypothetical protein
MSWSLADFNYFKSLEQLDNWLTEIIAEMNREKEEIERRERSTL